MCKPSLVAVCRPVQSGPVVSPLVSPSPLTSPLTVTCDMGSSKKHKKHKDKDREKRSHDETPVETAAAEQRPLKLVLKVGSTSTTVDRSPSLHSHTIPVVPQDEEMAEMPAIMNQSESHEFGSSKKLKKKKSKKKHRKHSHHRHHHHRHKSTCHHSKSSSIVSKDHPEEMAASVAMEVEDQKVPIPDLFFSTPSCSAPPAVSLGNEVQAETPKSPLKVSLKTGSKILYSNYLHLIVKMLQKRDCQDFFAWPVTEVIAPGYYSIIQRPMDFSTIHKKIDLRIYETLQDLKADVKLMCDNAMTYNGPDTIYYKAAKKLWHFAKEKVFSRDSLNEMRASVSSTVLEPALTLTPLQPPPFVHNDVATVGTETTQFPVTDAFVPEPAQAEAEDDEDVVAAKILEQARAAAAGAAQRLTLAKPMGAHFSFIRQRSDGSTSLGIVGAHPSHDRYLKLENIVGKLPEGTPYLPPYTEPESSKVKVVESVETTPFSSYLPSIDSSKSKLTQEETSLLLSTYGDEEVGIPYTRSILEFSSESDYLIRMADNLLDILTQGHHAKVLQTLREEKAKETAASQERDEETKAEKDEVENQLQDTQVLLEDLEKMQRKRLSSTSKPTAPASEELELASVLTSKLTQIIGTCTAPVDLTDMASLRKAMGVQLKKD